MARKIRQSGRNMAAPEPIQLNAYAGTLVLDNSAHEAFLAQQYPDGTINQTLMVLDSPPLGDFDPAEVTAAWQYFSNKPGVSPGDRITVYGFCECPPNSNRYVLFVVRAS